MSLSGSGLSDQAIADNMFLSVRTVHFHLANARRKYNAGNTQECYVKAVRTAEIRCFCTEIRP